MIFGFKLFVLWLIFTPVAVVLFVLISMLIGIISIPQPIEGAKRQFHALWSRWRSFGSAMLNDE